MNVLSLSLASLKKLLKIEPVTSRSLTTLSEDRDVGSLVADYGARLFSLMDKAEPPSVFSKKGFYGSLMEWAMRDEHFKTQLFRFVDVLPSLASSAEIGRHLKE